MTAERSNRIDDMSRQLTALAVTCRSALSPSHCGDAGGWRPDQGGWVPTPTNFPPEERIRLKLVTRKDK
jgi:hypothetical protein